MTQMRLTPEKERDYNSSAIFENITWYKTIRTNRGKTVMLHHDGSASMIIPFEGINNTSMSEEDFEKMHENIQMIFDKNLTPNLFTVSFTMMRDANIKFKNIKQLPSFLAPRAEFLNNLAENYMLFMNRYYLTIHIKAVEEVKQSFLKKFYNNYIKYKNNAAFLKNEAFKGLDNRLTDLNKFADTLTDMLNNIGCKYKILDKKEEYDDILENFLRINKRKYGKVKIDHDNKIFSPRQQMFAGIDANMRKKDFTMDDYFHRVYTMEKSPVKVIYGKTIEYLQTFPAEFFYTISFRAQTHAETLNVFKFKLGMTRIQEGNNESAIVEDRTLTAETRRISDSYDLWADGGSVGLECSANFVLRISEQMIEQERKAKRQNREEVLRQYESRLNQNVFQEFGGSEWIAENNTQWEVFCQSIPGMPNMFKGSLKPLVLTSDNIPYFLPLYDNKRGHLTHNGVNHFIDSKGNRIDFDLMDPSLPAWNYSISGQTGSGKSVLVNTILTMQFAEMIIEGGKPPVICILDVGGDRGSYTKFMKMVDGAQINLSRNLRPAIQVFKLNPDRSLPKQSKIKSIANGLLSHAQKHNAPYDLNELEKRVYNFFNIKLDSNIEELSDRMYIKNKFLENFEFPHEDFFEDMFKLQPGECIPSTKKLNLITSFLDIVLSTNYKVIDGFENYDQTEIEDLVMRTYEKLPDRYPLMSDLYFLADEIVDKAEPSNLKLLQKLKAYTKQGQYHMFDQETNLDTSNNVILADLKGLESEPNLQAIYTLLISDIFSEKMYFLKGRRKLIIRDEAWSLMKNEKARNYFVEDLRTARKNGFATLSITQLPTDYLHPNPHDGRGIIANMQVTILCKFDSASICQEIGHEYQLSEDMIEAMTTLGLQKNREGRATHSQFMMIIGGGRNKQVYILNNILHPFEYQLYSSSADDNAVIDYYLYENKHFDKLEDVLWFLAEGRHIHDDHLIEYLLKAGATNMVKNIRKMRIS